DLVWPRESRVDTDRDFVDPRQPIPTLVGPDRRRGAQLLLGEGHGRRLAEACHTAFQTFPSVLGSLVRFQRLDVTVERRVLALPRAAAGPAADTRDDGRVVVAWCPRRGTPLENFLQAIPLRAGRSARLLG